MIYDDPYFLLLVLLICSTIYLSVRAVFNYKKSIIQAQERTVRNKPMDFQNMFSNVSLARQETEAMYNEALAKGATQEQLKPIEGRLKQLRFVDDNQWWLQYAAPYLEGMARRFLRF